MKRRTFLGAATVSLAATQLAQPAFAAGSPGGRYTVVARFWDAMPTGVTVSRHGRTFVNFPRWGDDVPFTVAELRGGKPVAYPNAEVNRQDAADLAGHLQSVQSVVVDPVDRLWILDTGSPLFAGSSYGGPKLVAVDLHTDRIVRTILFPPEVVPANSYPNDVRFDLRRGAGGMAFITDSGGPNGIIFMVRPAGGEPTSYETGSDGIALSADGRHLYYCPLSSRRLHRVATDALADPHATDADVAATVENLGFKPMADGLESDDKGRLYGGDLEHNAIWRRSPDGTYCTLAQGTDLNWIDILSIASDGHLYATANQLDRLAPFHEGQDLRRKPYLLVRLPIDAGPVKLV